MCDPFSMPSDTPIYVKIVRVYRRKIEAVYAKIFRKI